MDKNLEKLNKLKQAMKDLFSTVSTENFSDFKLDDGKVITSVDSELAVGSEIYLIDDAGNKVPLDNGDYTLEGGRVIKVSDNKVSEIVEVQVEGDKPAVEEPKGEEMAEGDKPAVEEPKVEKPEDEKSDDNELVARVDSIESQLVEITSLLEKLLEGNSEMMSRVKVIENLPGDEKVKTESKFSSVPGIKNMDAVLEFRELLNKAKK